MREVAASPTFSPMRNVYGIVVDVPPVTETVPPGAVFENRPGSSTPPEVSFGTVIVVEADFDSYLPSSYTKYASFDTRYWVAYWLSLLACCGRAVIVAAAERRYSLVTSLPMFTKRFLPSTT